MIYQTGDFVRVTNKVADNPHKRDLIGKLFTIKGAPSTRVTKKINDRALKAYTVFEDIHFFFEDELEPAAFPKDKLKNGMIVEYRDGTFRMVHNGLLIGDVKYSPLTDYDDELKSLENEDRDIINVYISTAASLSEIWKDYTLELLWTRNRVEPKKITLDDLEELLGYRVTVIG